MLNVSFIYTFHREDEKYFFTNVEYDSIAARLLALGTTIGSPQNLEMYKLTSNGFDDPHANGIEGTILTNGPSATLNNWKYTTYGSDHSAEFLVSSFSGGGGGFGAGGAALPVNLIYFSAKAVHNSYTQIYWTTAQEINSNYFELQRSANGTNFTTIARVSAKGNSNSISQYHYEDKDINASKKFYYRINAVDMGGENSMSRVVSLVFNEVETCNKVIIFPNPASDKISFESADEIYTIRILNIQGQMILQSNESNIDISKLTKGVYVCIVSTSNGQQKAKLNVIE